MAQMHIEMHENNILVVFVRTLPQNIRKYTSNDLNKDINYNDAVIHEYLLYILIWRHRHLTVFGANINYFVRYHEQGRH